MFTKEYRSRLVGEVAHRFKCYWHAVHPQVFKPNDLYRLAFTKEEWNAMMLLRERYRSTLTTGYCWHYTINKTEHNPRIRLQFSTDDEMPQLELNEDDIPEPLATAIKKWAVRALYYSDMDDLLRKKLRTLVRLEFRCIGQNNERIERAIVNTPGTLHRVWPEVVPFLDNQSRDVMREKSMKSPMPKIWDDDDYKEFHEGPEMEALTEALTAMALLPNEYDMNYPEILG